MNSSEQASYLSLISATYEFLSFKINSLDEETTGRPAINRKNTEGMLIMDIVESGEFVHNLSEDTKKEHTSLRGCIADILETVYLYIIKEREARNSVHKELIVQLIPEYIAISRRLNEKLNYLKATVSNNSLPKEEYVQDSRLELILNALKKSSEFKQTISKEYVYRPHIAGFAFAIVLAALLSTLPIVFIKCYGAATEILSLITNNSPSNEINIYSTVYWDVLCVIHITIMVLAVIVLICFWIRGMHLKKEINTGNISARFVYAHYYTFPLLAKFGIDLKKYVYEMLECAKSGYPLALYQVGKMYEEGYRGIIQKNLKLAIHYYSCASKYVSLANERYKVLTQKFN